MKEVCIVGGGVVGLCCAYYLREAGLDVTIIDKGDFTDGCSWGNAGMIVPSHFIPLASPATLSKGIQWMFKRKSPFSVKPRFNVDLLRWLWLFERSADLEHVIESAPLLRDLHLEGREFYVQLNQKPGFNFDLESKGILMLYQTEETEKEEEETADMAYTLGIEAKKLSHSDVLRLEPGIKIDVRGAIHFPGDAHLHPQKLMQQLIAHLKESGVEFLSGNEVIGMIDMEKNGCALKLDSGESIRAKNVIIASGAWSGRLLKQNKIRLPLEDGKGYSMTVKDLGGKPSIPSILVEARVAMTPLGNDLRISGTFEISGMDNKIRLHKVKSILDAVPEYYPNLKINEPGEIWYGYRPCSPDGLPYIGRWKEHSSVVIATGHAMMGLSLAPATGRMVKDIIVNNQRGTIAKKLSPSRFS